MAATKNANDLVGAIVVRYGDMHKDIGAIKRYCLVERLTPAGKSDEGDEYKLLYQDNSKSRVIAEAQKLKGWEPVNGSEITYGIQMRQNGAW